VFHLHPANLQNRLTGNAIHNHRASADHWRAAILHAAQQIRARWKILRDGDAKRSIAIRRNDSIGVPKRLFQSAPKRIRDARNSRVAPLRIGILHDFASQW